MANINRAIKPKWELHDLSDNLEYELYESYIVEFTDIAGIKVDYFIRDEARIDDDRLYGEPLYQNVTYLPALATKLIYEPSEEPTLTNSFGMVSEDMVQYASIPKFTFTRDVSGGYHPKPGDVINIVWNNRAYEVVDVHEEDQIFQLQKPLWGFILKAYRYSEQSESAENISRFTREPTPAIDPDMMSTPLTAFGDNEYIEEESDKIDRYGDVDTTIYGY